MVLKSSEPQRVKKRPFKRRKRRRPLEKEESAILSPVNLPVGEPVEPPQEETPSFLERALRLFVGETRSPQQEMAFAPAVDPMRAILAIPDGIGRLEAFKEMLQRLSPESIYFRGMSLSFRKYVMELLEKSQLPPASVAHHLQPCIEALQRAGLHADAQLLLELPPFDVYAPHQLYLNAHEKADLEAIDEEIAFNAKIAFRSFELEMLKNNREKALRHLSEAVRAAPGHPEYQAAHQYHRALRPKPFQLTLTKNQDRATLCAGRQFLWGRDDKAHLNLRDPRCPRELALISCTGARRWTLTRLDKTHEIYLDNALWHGDQLPPEGTLQVLGHRYRITVLETGLHVRLEGDVEESVFMSPVSIMPVPATPMETLMPLNFTFDDAGQAFLLPTEKTRLNDEEIGRKTLLLGRDRIANPSQSWDVENP